MPHERKPPPLGRAAAAENSASTEPQQNIQIQPNPQRFPQPRLQRLAERIHALGPRVLYELVVEQLRDGGDFGVRVEKFAGIDPKHLRLTGGDRFPARFSMMSGGVSG